MCDLSNEGRDCHEYDVRRREIRYCDKKNITFFPRKNVKLIKYAN
jgi:hypothetical protein